MTSHHRVAPKLLPTVSGCQQEIRRRRKFVGRRAAVVRVFSEAITGAFLPWVLHTSALSKRVDSRTGETVMRLTNIRFEERVANGPEQLPIYAAELASLAPDTMFVTGSGALQAMRHATSDIPIVFSVVADPVGQGFVSSLARPGGNITGFANDEFGVARKQLDLLKKLAPAVDRVVLLYDPSHAAAAGIWAEIEAGAPSLALHAARCRFGLLTTSSRQSARSHVSQALASTCSRAWRPTCIAS